MGDPKPQTEKTCFVISPIGDEGTETRKHADQVLHLVAKAVVPLGYRPLRADQIGEPGLIGSQVITQLIDAPLVVADLTDHNPNVFYELAVRHLLHKPYIQIISSGQRIRSMLPPPEPSSTT